MVLHLIGKECFHVFFFSNANTVVKVFLKLVTIVIKSISISIFNCFLGPGGGTIFLNATYLLEIDGILSADGGDSLTEGGGGSGGSVWIHCYVIKGYGRITANGGSSPHASYHHGGGGAGGRIAVYFRQNDTFSYFR